MTQPIRGAVFPLTLAACVLLGAGCKKEKESLVIAQLQLAAPDPNAANLLSASLALTPGPTRTFRMVTLSADTTTDFGVYIPGDITGDVSIVAIVLPRTGCAGFRGTGSVTIGAAGATETTMITMVAADVCASDGGGGSGGTTGAGGSGGNGGTGGATAGRGGTGGTAGSAGTTGSGGSAGATAGTGGGTAGKGGAGGTTGGTGGMAGYPSISNCRQFVHSAIASCNSTAVRAIAISPNGQMVATVGNDYRVKIWSFDGQTLTAATVFSTNAATTGAAFSSDGTRFVFTDGATVRTYTVSGWAAGTTLKAGTDNLVGVGLTPDGMRVISVDDKGSSGGNVYVHDITTTTGTPAITKAVTDEPWSLGVSPRAAGDGSVGIAVGSYYGTVQVLTLTGTGLTGPTKLTTRTVYAPVDSVRFSVDGAILAEGEDYGAVRFWSTPVTSATQAPIADSITFAGGDQVNAIAFAPNGKYFALGGSFSTGVLGIYDVSSQAELTRLSMPPLTHNIASLAFTPNGAAIIAGEDDCGYVLVCN